MEWWLVPKMCKQRQSVPKCLLWPAVVALLIRCTFVSEMRTEFGDSNSSSFTNTFKNAILRYGWTLYMNYYLILKTKTVSKDWGLGPLLCEVSVDKSMSQVWELHSCSTQRTTCNLSTVSRTWRCGQRWLISLVVRGSSCTQLQAKVTPQSPALGDQHLAIIELLVALETFLCTQKQTCAECES